MKIIGDGKMARLENEDPMPLEFGLGRGLALPRYACLVCGVRFWEMNLAYLHIQWHEDLEKK